MKLTFEIVNDLLRLDAHTGKLFWRLRDRKYFSSDAHWKRWNKRYAGKEAFTADNGKGYRNGCLFGCTYRANRIVWLICTGSWPIGELDHENGIRSDDRPVNLRDIGRAENLKNQKRYANNKSGVTGVRWRPRRGRWCAQISANGVQMHLGNFKEFEDAVAARKAAERRFGFHKNHGRAA